jgi:hypothetical protein
MPRMLLRRPDVRQFSVRTRDLAAKMPSVNKRSRRRRLFVEALEHRLCLAAVPPFSSLPGANHTIYLDFDGQTVTGTSWSSYYNQTTLVAQPFNIDSDASTFSTTELARIEEAWKRVAEDFRAFNVNVTTVDPGIEALRKSGSGDTQWGVRAIITNESTMVTDSAEYCGCGGVAYIDSFNWNSDTPVWVYTTGGKSIAEAASHEVGHSLGLSHDGLTDGTTYYSGHGSGETGWASIMGVGYYQNVTQWDRGEYYNSNNGGSGANYGDGPDDLALIVGTAGPGNGFSYRADDHGNTNATASSLTAAGTAVSGGGIIERTTDIDVFSFATGAGQVTLNIAPFTPGPNLDIKAELFDSSNTLIATSNSSTVLSAAFSLNLAAGQYYLRVDGTGWGNPTVSPPTGYSEYGSLGQYSIAGTVVDPGSLPAVSIGDASAAETAGAIDFTLTLSAPATTTSTVNWTTVNGSATGGQDFVAASGTVTFQAGDTTANVSVVLTDDAVYEGNEQFAIALSSPTAIVIADGQAVGTIVENDSLTPPTISINDASVNEGKFNTNGKNAGTPQLTNLTFSLTLSAASTQAITVNFNTADGLATIADNDYQYATGTVTFSPGQTSKTISVVVVGDNTVEPNETFSVNLSAPTNATLGDGIGVGTIVNDDGTKGGGRPNRSPAEDEAVAVAIADPMWFFESPDDSSQHFVMHDHGPDFDHDHAAHEEHDGADALFASLSDDSQQSLCESADDTTDAGWLNVNLAAHDELWQLISPESKARASRDDDSSASDDETKADELVADSRFAFALYLAQ